MYVITKLRLLQGAVDYTVKNDLDSSFRHHFWPIYTFRSSNLFIDHFIASKNRLVSDYGHFVHDITKLRLLQGCVDYNVKNYLDSSSRQHFWPIYIFRSSNLYIDHFIASKNRLVSVYGHYCMISLNWGYYRDALIIMSKTISIRHLGTIFDLYTPSDHQIYLLIISLHLKIDCVSVYGPLVYDITILRLKQGCVDYKVKNDLDSSSRHHFWPIYTFRSSNLFNDHFIASTNRLVSVYGP